MALQRINFYKLDTAALKRYRRFYKLPDVGNSKEQLVMAVGKHFMSQVGSCLIHAGAATCLAVPPC